MKSVTRRTKFATLKTLMVAGLVAVCSVGLSEGAIIIDITESGADLLVTTSGSLDLTGLTHSNNNTNPVGFRGDGASYFAFSQNAQDYYNSGFTGGAAVENFSSVFSFISPTVLVVSGGADFGLSTLFGAVWTPDNYSSGSSVSQVLRISGQSFASLGINLGEFAELSWTNAGGDSIRMQASGSVSAVPEPSSTALLGLGGLALMLRRRR